MGFFGLIKTILKHFRMICHLVNSDLIKIKLCRNFSYILNELWFDFHENNIHNCKTANFL